MREKILLWVVAARQSLALQGKTGHNEKFGGRKSLEPYTRDIMIKENIDLPNRCHPAHPRPLQKHNCPIIIFLTVCLTPRRPILNNKEAHQALQIAWSQANEWAVGYYLIMPDHIHLFCSPTNGDDINLTRWVTFWKRLTSKNYSPVSGMWQNDYWDTQIRSSEHWQQKAEYVRNNPMRYGLTENNEEWLYQGVISELWW